MQQESAAANGQEVTRRLAELTERSQRLFETLLARNDDPEALQVADPRSIGQAFAQLGQAMFTDPERLIETNVRYWQEMSDLWQAQVRRAMGEEVSPQIAPLPGDRRFKDQAWNEAPVFDYLKQSYLLTARWIQDAVAGTEGLDKRTREKVNFWTRQYVDAISPTNFVLTNPAVLRTAVETKGESLYAGLKNLLDDLERGKGELKISMTQEEAFDVGTNIAATPGKVIYQNTLMQLIQYSPTTEQVFKRPLLIVPPWINKFYILDLKPKNSFIKWALDQGLTVFVISWINPPLELRDKTFEDYMFEGPIEAMRVIEEQLGVRELNLIGYCIGGTLTACTLAYMRAKGDERVKSVTFFTTMLDFSEPGELGIFLDEEQLDQLEERMAKKGYLEAKHMQQVFNLLRANDLIWSFVVNNYLMGKEPMAFDLLYWNGDSTRMPFEMHRYYLRNMYQKNLLVQPGGITLDGVPIDLGQVKVPAYFVSTREDHIAPWRSTYVGARLLGGPVRFVLGGSGHIAGVINPASSNKYGYWTKSRLLEEPERWLEAADHKEGSWWPDWLAWIARKGGSKVPARRPEDGKFPPLEDAPGSYVKMRALE